MPSQEQSVSVDDRVGGIVASIRAAVGADAAGVDVAIVCGSGLGGLVDCLEPPLARVPYAAVGLPASTVSGHGSELVFGRLGGKRVVAQRGRFHFYEGHDMGTVALPARVFAALGARVLVVTNAAGGLNAAFKVADVMVIRDHISLPALAGAHPLRGPNADAFGPRFPPLTAAYSPSLAALARASAAALGLAGVLREGVYLHDSGPSYETPAEVAAMRVLGGDAVGMSTAPEVVAAAHAGVAVLGLSLITNECRAPGDTGVPPSHEEVLAASDARAVDVARLVADVVRRVDASAFPRPPAAAAFALGAPPRARAPGRGALAAAADAARAVHAPTVLASALVAAAVAFAVVRGAGGGRRA